VNGIAPPRLSQFALAELIERGYLDRHLRKARAVYKRRREALVESLGRELPDIVVGGVAAGLFVPVSLPPGVDEGALLTALSRRGVAVDGVARNSIASRATGLVLGFAAAPEPTLRQAVGELANALSTG
jgi:GntR family transcriptional regulator/MocR family aminotransferase